MEETAAQLFARLGTHNSLGSNLLHPLFSHLPPPGLKPRDVVEFCGGEGSGKTELLLNIVVECVLPKHWGEREIGGKGVDVLWICTDFKFDLLRLVAVLEGKMQRILSEKEATIPPHLVPQSEPNGTNSEQYNIPTLVTSCLEHVHIMHCNSTAVLATTLQYLRLIFLPKHPDVCVLVLDNVAEFCWVDRVEGGSVQAGKMKQGLWVGSLKQVLQEHHLVVLAARPLLYSQNVSRKKAEGKKNFPKVTGTDDMMCSLWQRLVQYRFFLCSTHTTTPPTLPVPVSTPHTSHSVISHCLSLHPVSYHSTIFTAQQMSPSNSLSTNAMYNFTVSSHGVKFL